jgi:peptide/nickel transport system permease protein
MHFSEAGKFLRRWLNGAKPILGVGIVLGVISAAIFAPLITVYSPIEADFSQARSAPSVEHWFGTDNLGRDVYSRVVYGGRVSLVAGLIPVLIAATLGGLFGLAAGYSGGGTEQFFMRVTDALMAFPPLVLALAIVYTLGPDLKNALIAIGVTMIPEYIRVVRGQVLSLKEKEFVEAAHSIGVGHWRIMWRHLSPNLMAPVIVLATIGAGRAILIEAGLSFLGLGVQPPTPSWGSMIQNGYAYLDQAPWMAVFPGLAIVITVVGLNFLGDSLRDTLDPRLRGE